jgi:hypothetical protein
VTSEPPRVAAIVRLHDEVAEIRADLAQQGALVDARVVYESPKPGSPYHTFAVALRGVQVAVGRGDCADQAAHNAWCDLTGNRDGLPLQRAPRQLAEQAAALAANDRRAP